MRLAPSSDLFRARAAAAAAVLLVAGCGGAPSTSVPAAPVAEATRASGFLAPPSPIGAVWTAQGGVALTGRAPAQATVTLRAPEGGRLDAVAAADGRWSAQAPSAAGPRLFALSAQAGGRTLRGEGAIALLPPSAATPALLLRSGAPALPIARPASATLRLVSLDYDAGGGFAVSGSAPPGAAVGLTLDGTPAGQGKADGAGRFAVLSISAPVPPGDHLVAVRAGEGVDARIVAFTPAGPLAAPYQAAVTPQGWRIDWSPPGGGVQTLMAFARRPSSTIPAPSAPRAGTPGRSGA